MSAKAERSGKSGSLRADGAAATPAHVRTSMLGTRKNHENEGNPPCFGLESYRFYTAVPRWEWFDKFSQSWKPSDAIVPKSAPMLPHVYAPRSAVVCVCVCVTACFRLRRFTT